MCYFLYMLFPVDICNNADFLVLLFICAIHIYLLRSQNSIVSGSDFLDRVEEAFLLVLG